LKKNRAGGRLLDETASRGLATGESGGLNFDETLRDEGEDISNGRREPRRVCPPNEKLIMGETGVQEKRVKGVREGANRHRRVRGVDKE